MELGSFPLDPALAGCQKLFLTSPQMMCIIDSDLHFKQVNPAFECVLGHGRQVLMSRPVTDFVHRDDVGEALRSIRDLVRDHKPREFDSRLFRADGSYRRVHWSMAMSEEDGSIYATALDAEKAERAQELTVRREADPLMYDAATGLPARALMIDRIGQAVRRCRRDPAETFGVLFIDFNYKDPEDVTGGTHDPRLLRLIAERLTHCLRTTDTVSLRPSADDEPVGHSARFVGDEFIVLLDGVKGERGMVTAAERLYRQLSEPYFVAGTPVNCVASIGWVLGGGGFSGPHDLIHCADEAMYQARDKGGGCVMYRRG